jgi:hypothetical protein
MAESREGTLHQKTGALMAYQALLDAANYGELLARKPR